MSDLVERPRDSNADAWHLFLSKYLDARANFPYGMAFMAVQIAEAIDDAVREQCEAKDAEIERLNKLLYGVKGPVSTRGGIEEAAVFQRDLARASAENERLKEERDEARALFERVKLEAQIRSGEARTHKSTVHECYQAASGATGEPGNWHGAQPVRDRITSLSAENERLRKALGNILEADTIRNVCGWYPEIVAARAALEAETAVDGDAQWNAACDAAATVADRLVGEWHSDLADGCAREAATAIRSLKRLK
jgi:hypothetical protein